MKKFSIILISLIILSSGCRKRPEGVLSDSEMEKLLVDLALAEAYEQNAGSNTLPDSIRNRLGEAVLKKHKVDSANLDKTYNWYACNIDDYYRLYDNVERRLQGMRSKVSGVNIGDNSENNLWNLPNHFYFSPISPSSSYVFDLNADKLVKGDILEWKLRLSAPVEADLTLGIDYADSSISLTNRTFNNERSLRLKLLSDSGKTVRRIFGTISINRNDYPLWIDSIALLRSDFDSTQYSTFRFQKFSLGARRISKVPKKVSTDTLISNSPDIAKPGQDTASQAARRAKMRTLQDVERRRNYR